MQFLSLFPLHDFGNKIITFLVPVSKMANYFKNVFVLNLDRLRTITLDYKALARPVHPYYGRQALKAVNGQILRQN